MFKSHNKWYEVEHENKEKNGKYFMECVGKRIPPVCVEIFVVFVHILVFRDVEENDAQVGRDARLRSVAFSCVPQFFSLRAILAPSSTRLKTSSKSSSDRK